MKQKEIWRDIVGYEGLYQVSNLGRVRSLEHYVSTKGGAARKSPSKILSNCFDGKYLHVILHKNGRNKVCLIHRLVATAFIPKPENKQQVNHIDGNKLNNFISNLEWCNGSENLKHAYKTGLATPSVTHYRGIKAFKASDKTFVGEYSSQHEAARVLGLNVAHICSVLKGRASQTKGYYFEYNNKDKKQKRTY